MRVKTSELTGGALDWAVAKAQLPGSESFDMYYTHAIATCNNILFRPSTSWDQGGPIIEREGILLRPIRREGHFLHGQCLAMFDGENTGTIVQWVRREDWPRHYFSGSTPLIAAMRCYVASKLGNEVEIPDELIGE